MKNKLPDKTTVALKCHKTVWMTKWRPGVTLDNQYWQRQISNMPGQNISVLSRNLRQLFIHLLPLVSIAFSQTSVNAGPGIYLTLATLRWQPVSLIEHLFIFEFHLQDYVYYICIWKNEMKKVTGTKVGFRGLN